MRWTGCRVDGQARSKRLKLKPARGAPRKYPRIPIHAEGVVIHEIRSDHIARRRTKFLKIEAYVVENLKQLLIVQCNW